MAALLFLHLYPTPGKKLQLPIGFFQISLGLLALGDVLSGPKQARDSARIVLPRESKLSDILQFPAPHFDAVLHRERFSARFGFGVYLQDPRSVLGPNARQKIFVRAAEGPLFNFKNPI